VIPRAPGGGPPSDVQASIEIEVHTLRDGEAADRPHPDRIAVEAPLEVRVGDKPATVLMRTPGDDEELVRGFLFTEGMIGASGDLVSLTRPPDLDDEERGNVVTVEVTRLSAIRIPERSMYSSSSCGVCGKTSIGALAIRAEPIDSKLTVGRDVVQALPPRMRAAQTTFRQTGGVHASGIFTSGGELLAVREDVGRHNALDKLIGWALAAGRVPLHDCVLLVSGRVSYELVQKAIVAGVPILAAVGAPSSFAVRLAEQFGVTMVGFVRDGSMNVYSHPGRIGA
jgi:FdhD protein